MHRFAFLVCFAIGCGGKAAPAQHAGDEHHGDEHGGGDHHAKLPPELTRFHDVLAPRWHAAKGPDRVKSTCDAVADFRTRSEDVARATAPVGADAEKWAKEAKLLATAVNQLGTACAEHDDTFELAFAEVHTSFEALVATATHEH